MEKEGGRRLCACACACDLSCACLYLYVCMFVCLYVCMYVCMYVRERASWGNDSSRATDGGMLALIVDPVVPYARSRFRQRQDFHLRPPSDTGIGGSLALIDWYHFPTHPSTPRHVAERKFDQVPRS